MDEAMLLDIIFEKSRTLCNGFEDGCYKGKQTGRGTDAVLYLSRDFPSYTKHSPLE